MQAIFLDTETTGVDPMRHRMLEIAFKVIDIPSGVEKFAYQSIVRQPEAVWNRRDLCSTEINGFTFDKMNQGKEESAVAAEIKALFLKLNVVRGSTVYICQNPAFDRTFFGQLVDFHTQEEMHWPYHWLDLASMYWALQMQNYRNQQYPFPKTFSLSKNAIAEHFSLPPETVPHTAMNGVDHLILCYKTVVGFYG